MMTALVAIAVVEVSFLVCCLISGDPGCSSVCPHNYRHWRPYINPRAEPKTLHKERLEPLPRLDLGQEIIVALEQIRKERRALDRKIFELEAKLEPAGFREPAIQLEAVVEIPVEVSKK